MKPSISVIIPVFNREDLIVRSLNSVLNQTVLPYEIIVVDNDSNDGTLNKVNKFFSNHDNSNCRFIIAEEKKRGAWAARQIGLELSSGDFVYFLDSDDEIEPDLIELALTEIIRNPELDIVCWKCEINQLNGKKRVSPVSVKFPLEYHLIHGMLKTVGYTVRKSFLVNSGGWNMPLKVWDDYELGLRLLLENPMIKLVNKVLVNIYPQKDSISGLDFSSKSGQWELTLGQMREDVKRESQDIEHYVKKMLDYREVILAACYYKEGKKELGNGIFKKVISKSPEMIRLILWIAYHYTRWGGRGSWVLLRLVGLSI